jgi:hypothetical protein
MLIKINLDNVDYNVVYSPVNNKVDVKLYKPLVRELWKIATQHEKEKLIIIINETKTIFLIMS